MISYNMHTVSPRPVGTVATYTCVTGYTLTGGNRQRHCLIGGMWSGSPPVCQRKWNGMWTILLFVEFTRLSTGICSDLPSLTNGMISYRDGSSDIRPVNSVATYTCDTGYTLNGNTIKTCGSDGVWSGSTPVCQRKWNGMPTIHLLSEPISLQVSALTYPH